MEIHINDSDSIAVFGSGSLVRKCIQSVRRFSGCRIFVFEKKLSGISALETQTGRIGGTYYCRVGPDVEKSVIEINPKIIFSISNTYLFKDALISRFPIVNYHNALLPMHPGRHAESWTIFLQDAVAGVTWHFVDKKVDTGDIILQEEVPLHGRITSIQLLSRQARAAHRMFEAILRDIFESRSLKGYRQPLQENVKQHFSWERPNGGLLDLSWDAGKISAFLRSMDYGKLPILGKPSLRYGEASFAWDDYVIEEAGGEKGAELDLENGKAIFTGGGISVKLLGLHEA